MYGCTPLTVLDPVQPVIIQGETKPIAVGAIAPTVEIKSGIIGKFHGGAANIAYATYGGQILRGMDARFRITVYDELKNAGYKVLGQKHNIFVERQITTPAGASFSIGGVVRNVRYNTYSSVFKQSTESSARVAWTLTDVQTGRAVCQAETGGKVEGPHEDTRTILEAVRMSFRKVLADELFGSKLR